MGYLGFLPFAVIKTLDSPFGIGRFAIHVSKRGKKSWCIGEALKPDRTGRVFRPPLAATGLWASPLTSLSLGKMRVVSSDCGAIARI